MCECESEKRPFTFDVVAEDPKTHARAGVLHTPHGDIPTPIFMPVGTKATVKGLLPPTLHELGTKINRCVGTKGELPPEPVAEEEATGAERDEA